MPTASEIDAVVGTIECAPALIVPMVREIPAERLTVRPAPGRWSAHEHACHLAEVHRLFFDRLDRMTGASDAVIEPYQPSPGQEEGAFLELDLATELERFRRDRRRLVERLRGLAPADWERTAKHPEYSHYSVFILFRHVAMHDHLHAYRIEEILLAPDL